jgi:hypothetical protein
MTDEMDLAPVVRSWFRETLPPASRSSHVIEAAIRTARTVRQQRHPWPPLPLSAIDRPVSAFPARELVPVATPATNGRTRPKRSAVLSMLKFVVAGVIVVAFGGFLLSGILTTQDGEVAPAAVTESPSPTTNVDILPGVTLTVEEVGPGVHRVTSDGVRDLTSVEAVDIVAGYDGGIRLLRQDEFQRLGTDRSHEWPVVGPESNGLEVAPDGTTWVIPCGSRPFHNQCGDARRSTDGEEWTVEPCPEGSTDCQGSMVAPEGRVWASWKEGGGWRVGHLGPTGWQPLDGFARSEWSPFRGYQRLFVTDAGDIYGMDRWDLWRYTFGSEDGGWEPFFDLTTYNPWRTLVDVGPDGTVWLGLDGDRALTRWVDGEWERWASEEVLPDTRYTLGLEHEFKVAPDGSLWFDLWQQAFITDDGFASTGNGDLMDAVGGGRLMCDGLARFDGQRLRRFLRGQCISMDIAADGSVWALAADELPYVFDDGLGGEVFAEDHTWDLYVITPEAVTAKE